MNYPFELRRREAAAVDQRRQKARTDASPGLPGAGSSAANSTTAAGWTSGDLPRDTVGLALSGGGIRCATFSLGVLQSLARHNRLRDVDFLSTVSGGGYAGSFVGRLFTRPVIIGQPDPCGRVQDIVADSRSQPIQWLRAHADYLVSQGGSDWRQHVAVLWRNLASIYLTLGFLGLAAFGSLRMLGDLLIRWFGPPPFSTALGPTLGGVISPWWWLPIVSVVVAIIPGSLAYWLTPKPGTRATFSFYGIAAWITLLTGLAFGLSLPGGIPICTPLIGVVLLTILWIEVSRRRLPPALDPSTRESAADTGTVIRNRLTRALGEAIVWLFLSVLWVLVDTLSLGLAQGVLWKQVATWAALIAPAIPFLRGWATKLGQANPSPGVRTGGISGFFGKPEVKAALIAFPLAGFLLVILDGAVHWIFNRNLGWGYATCLLGAALSIILGRAFDFLNVSSLQQNYSARLTRTFLGATNPARLRSGTESSARDVELTHPDDDINFDQYHPELAGGPIHLIGLCINETVDAASQREIHDRKSLPMCLGPCGVSVGRRFHALWSQPPVSLPWIIRVKRWLDGRVIGLPHPNNALRAIPLPGELFHVLKGRNEDPASVEPLKLGTWVAISGAAFGTGVGRLTSLPHALLFGLVNLRLGYWWDSGILRSERAGQYQGNFWRRIKAWPAGLARMQSLMLCEFKGRFGGPGHRFWNISDGGHFDNTGIYELVRRQVPFIIAVDGGEDPDLTFSDLAELVRQVRVDFGAQIEAISDPMKNLVGNPPNKPPVPAWITQWLNPDSFGPREVIGKANGKHAALLKVTHAGAECRVSWIVLLKASVTGDESLDVTDYRQSHPDFPGESTLDQFFSEAQWESYRMLGEHVGDQVVFK